MPWNSVKNLHEAAERFLRERLDEEFDHFAPLWFEFEPRTQMCPCPNCEPNLGFRIYGVGYDGEADFMEGGLYSPDSPGSTDHWAWTLNHDVESKRIPVEAQPPQGTEPADADAWSEACDYLLTREWSEKEQEDTREPKPW